MPRIILRSGDDKTGLEIINSSIGLGCENKSGLLLAKQSLAGSQRRSVLSEIVLCSPDSGLRGFGVLRC